MADDIADDKADDIPKVNTQEMLHSSHLCSAPAMAPQRQIDMKVYTLQRMVSVLQDEEEVDVLARTFLLYGYRSQLTRPFVSPHQH